MDTGWSTTRRALLTRGLGAGVAGAAAAAGLTGAGLLRPAAALAATTTGAPTTPSERMARLLGVEMLLHFCYQHVIASPLLTTHERRTLVPLRTNEEAHVKALQATLKTLRGNPPRGPVSVEQANQALAHREVGGRLGELKNSKDALYLLLAVERVVVGAYFVALAKLENPSLMTLAAEIMANDAQHEAILGQLLNPKRPGAAVPYGLVQGVQ